jgi:hypothetical protein
MRTAGICLLICIALSARAEIYRCMSADGQTRFTDNATDCQGAQPVNLPPRPAARCGPTQDCTPPAPASNAQTSGTRADLASNFLPLGEWGAEWTLVEDAPEPIDSELRGFGLRDTSTRHYSRSAGRTSQVCSVELWQFDRTRSASAVANSLELPHWQVLRAGSLLVLSHGVRLSLGAASDSSLHATCAELGRRTVEYINRK